jgi:hypothetical protein
MDVSDNDDFDYNINLQIWDSSSQIVHTSNKLKIWFWSTYTGCCRKRCTHAGESHKDPSSASIAVGK